MAAIAKYLILEQEAITKNGDSVDIEGMALRQVHVHNWDDAADLISNKELTARTIVEAKMFFVPFTWNKVDVNHCLVIKYERTDGTPDHEIHRLDLGLEFRSFREYGIYSNQIAVVPPVAVAPAVAPAAAPAAAAMAVPPASGHGDDDDADMDVDKTMEAGAPRAVSPSDK